MYISATEEEIFGSEYEKKVFKHMYFIRNLYIQGHARGRVVKAHATYAANPRGPLLHVTSPSLSHIFICLLLNKGV